MTQLIFKLRDKAGVDQLGGKGAALARSAEHGFDVPPFFVLSTAAFSNDGLQATAHAELIASLEQLGPGPYAARSSAIEEDGAANSHAGQFLSVLNVSAKDIPDACLQVWRSGANAAVNSYRESRGIDGDSSAPAVIVQQMIDARCAGVAFSADPVSGLQDRFVISAISGLGDRLVGGEEDGETYILGRASGARLRGPDTGVLSSEDIAALHQLIAKVADFCGAPQDIEWAFEGSKLFLLQTRPITTALRPSPLSDDGVIVFDNSNIIESYPGIVSPLTYSFAQYAYSRVYRRFVSLVGVSDASIRAHADVFDNMLARLDGRVYYNLINWYRALALLPGFSLNRAYMETMMGVSSALPQEIADDIAGEPPKGVALAVEWLKIAGVGLKLGFEALRLRLTVGDFYKRLNLALAQPATELDTMPLTSLAAEYRRIEADLLDRWDAPLVNDFLCMIAFGASRKLLEKWAGDEGLAAHNDIMIGQGDIISAEPAKRIRAMGAMAGQDAELTATLERGDGDLIARSPELEKAVAAYIEKFGDRCTEELKLESIPLERDPAPLYMAIASATRKIPAAQNTHAADEQKNTDSLGALFATKPVKRWLARLLVGWARRRVRDRENLRFERTRIFGRARHLFRAVGRQFHAHGLLDDPDDIFYLTVQEVLGAIEGFAVSNGLSGIVALRKAETTASVARPDPEERIIVKGAAISGLHTATPQETPADNNERERSGTGCSAGCVKSAARLISDPRTQGIKPGEILVARHTDPGWIAVFSNASAIVVERGSLLSHSAIVARELGIPCVVGLKSAMKWIVDGETIEVDGATGKVRKTDG